MNTFNAVIKIIGINPYVSVPNNLNNYSLRIKLIKDQYQLREWLMI